MAVPWLLIQLTEGAETVNHYRTQKSSVSMRDHRPQTGVSLRDHRPTGGGMSIRDHRTGSGTGV